MQLSYMNYGHLSENASVICRQLAEMSHRRLQACPRAFISRSAASQ